MFPDDGSSKVAEFLLQVKAVMLRPNDPFTWASGIKSPIYCDNRKTLSYPRIRTFIRQELVKKVQSGFGRPDVIAGVATGGIAFGALVAQDLGLPFVYVRPEPKQHGTGSQIEGQIDEGQSVLVIEDLVSTGKSSLNAVQALRDHGCMVKGMVAIFTYGLNVAKVNFKKAGVPLVTLTDYPTLIEKATEQGYVANNDLEKLKAWRDSPKEWGASQA